jgi:hypothetical protein
MPKKGIWVDKEREIREEKAAEKDIDNSIQDFEADERIRKQEATLQKESDRQERLRLERKEVQSKLKKQRNDSRN